MLGFLKKSEEAALAPLIELAMSRHGYDRVHFLTELRRDAPTVAALVEQRLGDDNPLQAVESVRIRQRAGLGVALENATRRHAAFSSEPSTSQG